MWLLSLVHLAWSQVAFLTYRLPALACAPPLLLRLMRQHSPKGTLLHVEIVASPNLPGQLSGVKLALNVPSAVSAPSKVTPYIAALVTQPCLCPVTTVADEHSLARMASPHKSAMAIEKCPCRRPGRASHDVVGVLSRTAFVKTLHAMF